MLFGERNARRYDRRRRFDRLARRLERSISQMFDSNESWHELRDVLDDLPELVATFDQDGRLLYLNESGRRLLVWEGSEESLLSDFFSERDSERLLQEALSLAAGKRPWSGWAELVRPGGKPLAVKAQLVTHKPVEKKLRAFTVVARPIVGDVLEAADLHTASSRFLHDLNNLLGPIIAYANLAEAQVEKESAIKRYLGHILGAARRAQELVARALRPKRDRKTEELSRIVLAELVREIVDWLRVEHPGQRFEVDAASNASLYGDRGALEQVILNLSYNAVESVAEEGGLISISVHELPDDRALRLTVRDNGCGMDPELLSRVFEPFYSTKPDGTGVGLAATREVVREHGGTIDIESAPGVGTAVHVKLPLGEPQRP